VLATKGVNSDRRPALVKSSVPIGEDTGTEIHEIKDSEETRVSGSWRGDRKPECTYVIVDGDNLAEFLSRERSSDESESEVVSAVPPADVSTAVSAAVSGIVSNVVSEAESEGPSWPAPQEDSDDCRVEGGTVKYFTPQEAAPRAKPEWWTEAWKGLQGA
jgi:hypothetical protein